MTKQPSLKRLQMLRTTLRAHKTSNDWLMSLIIDNSYNGDNKPEKARNIGRVIHWLCREYNIDEKMFMDTVQDELDSFTNL